MLKFFRTIRQKLLAENRFSKYMVYAVGEIILVVIGILIALQINNWNETQKIKHVEQEYLQLLKKEFDSNLQNLGETMKICEQNLKAGLALSKYTGPTPPQISDKELAGLILGVVSRETYFETNSGVLEEIIGSGKLVVFSNKELRSALSSWNGKVSKIRKQEEELSRWRFGIIDFGKTHDSSRKIYNKLYGQFFDLPDSKFETRIGTGLQNKLLEAMSFQKTSHRSST